jgi:codanin-1
MLGYLYFLPYRAEASQFNRKPIAPINVEVYLQSQISFRVYQSFPIDLYSILGKGLKQRRLVFTLPWIIELLSQADQVTFHLPKFKPVLTLISSIYREVLSLNGVGSGDFCFCLENKTFLRFFCGKLFGLPTFPDFYLFQSSERKLSSILPPHTQMGHENQEESVCLDMQPFIGSTFIPLWFRAEIKQAISVLSSNATVRGSIPAASPGVVKHVRPIPIPERMVTILSPTSENLAEAESPQAANPKGNLQLELETQFFSIHPPSLKKTVDFIAERVASNFVKQLRNQLLLEVKLDLVRRQVFEEAAVLACKRRISEQIEEYTMRKCMEAVNPLLAEGLSDGVRILCQDIATRKANEKIWIWADKHITKGKRIWTMLILK